MKKTNDNPVDVVLIMLSIYFIFLAAVSVLGTLLGLHTINDFINLF